MSWKKVLTEFMIRVIGNSTPEYNVLPVHPYCPKNICMSSLIEGGYLSPSDILYNLPDDNGIMLYRGNVYMTNKYRSLHLCVH